MSSFPKSIDSLIIIVYNKIESETNVMEISLKDTLTRNTKNKGLKESFAVNGRNRLGMEIRFDFSTRLSGEAAKDRNLVGKSIKTKETRMAGIKFTLKQLNITLKYCGAELVKGRGYFYFVPSEVNGNQKLMDIPSTSVYVNNLHDLSYRDWMHEYEKLEKQVREI